ncbi:MarR family winged helix-turn-helix transcriptional regulator [Salipaludibacillus daqingensis]|uniref:MarR family winged helix-turn-helix transcriptional regulator n=1 Tax=Salipaludibacillus daqingensis TaxID=3041001 RepID=UPI0024735FBF|nr:MarR family transcriptional regulator [Salipaludibacillus daqingensis]
MDIHEVISDIEERVFDISLILNREFGTEYENCLSSNQQLMLILVAKKGVKHVKDLAYHMNVSASAISQMVAKLEQLDIIYREIDESNRRSTILRLGSKGKDILAMMDENRSEIINKYLSKMSEKDLIEVMDAFRKLHETIIETEKGDPE